MVVASPRKDFRGIASVPTEWEDAADHLRMIVSALRQVQERARSIPVTCVSASATYSMVDTDGLIVMDTAGGNRTVFLLTAAGRETNRVGVKKSTAANTLTIDAAGAETIDGAATVAITGQWSYREFMSDGTNWTIVGSIGI